MSLILHCGAHGVPREELRNLPVPEPKGARHKPTSFYNFLDLVEEQLDKHALDVTEEAFGVTKDANRFFGLLQLQSKTVDYSIMVGLRASHDQSMARGVALGSRVMVCDNLAFSGEYMVRTKQTTHLEKRLPGLVTAAVHKLPGEIERQDKLIEQLKGMDLSGQLAESMIVEMLRRSIVTPSSLGRIVPAWDEPKEEYLTDGDRTAWTLYNVVTEELKPVDHSGNVPVVIERTLGLTELFEEVLDE